MIILCNQYEMVDLGRHFRYFETFYQGERKYSFEKAD